MEHPSCGQRLGADEEAQAGRPNCEPGFDQRREAPACDHSTSRGARPVSKCRTVFKTTDGGPYRRRRPAPTRGRERARSDLAHSATRHVVQSARVAGQRTAGERRQAGQCDDRTHALGASAELLGSRQKAARWRRSPHHWRAREARRLAHHAAGAIPGRLLVCHALAVTRITSSMMTATGHAPSAPARPRCSWRRAAAACGRARARGSASAGVSGEGAR